MAWVYKANEKKTDFPATLMLAKKGFLCRSAFNDDGARAALVDGVAVGDTLHFYFKDKKRGPRTIGSFEVIDAASHPKPQLFGAPVAQTALVEVVDPTFVSLLAGLGDYQPDKTLGVFTGWLLKPSTLATPPYDPKMFPGMATLRPWT